MIVQGAPAQGAGLLFASGETIADGQARSYPLTVAWPSRLGDAGPAGVSGWSSAGVAAVGGIAANGIARLYPEGTPGYAGSPLAWTRQHRAAALGRLGTWEDGPLGVAAYSGRTGAQDDQVWPLGVVMAGQRSLGAEQVGYLVALGQSRWQRRRPEESALHRVVSSAWTTVRARLEAADRPLPRFSVREVDAFLRCGILAHGFARVWCEVCGKDDVVAFSCKGRGFCPSCGARRMADTAAWLVDRVIPLQAPVRQWVLSLPYRLRLLCAYGPDACALVRRVLVRAVSGFYEGRVRCEGVARPRTGAVAFVQRFDSGLRLNVHFHVLWLDGVYGHEVGRGAMQWREHEDLADADVASLVRRVRDRVVKALRREGKWWDDTDAAAADADCRDEEHVLREVAAGAVVGRAVLGEDAGSADMRVDRGTRNEPFVRGPLCADCDGFSLHAGVRVPAGDRRRLEHLARYAGRPAVAASRLRLLPDGVLRMRSRSNGRTARRRW